MAVEQDLETLAQSVRGGVLRAGDAGYDGARTTWNAMIDRSPALIARCVGPADVIGAVNFGRDHDLQIAVHAGGHSAAGSSVCDGGLMIDLAPMKGIRVDPKRQTVRAEAGHTAAQSMLDALNPPGNRVYWKSEVLRNIDDDVLETLIERAAACPSPLSPTLIEFYGGVINRVGASDTAYPLRDALYALNAVSYWTDPAQDEANIAWARGTFDAVQPYSPGSVYVNFLGVGDGTEDRVKAAYGPNYPRLAQIKRAYDPNNVFRMHHNIVPAR